jgi:two-component system C4-dicarboxylate transport response regulator DctD
MSKDEISKDRKILLVEANDFIKDALMRGLEIEGFSIAVSPSAGDAFKIIKKERFDVIIADYELPDLNGLEFLILAGRARKDCIKILMTTYGELKILSDIKKYGIDDAIEKPFPFERLVNMIEYNLSRRKIKRTKTKSKTSNKR